MDFFLMMRAWFTIQVTTMFAKSALYVQAPIQYKGGAIFELYKGKGSHMDMDMYRSILLADVVGKIPARAHTLANLGVMAQDLSSEHTWQYSGVIGFGTEFPVLATRQLQEHTQVQGISIALIFVDARQAFHAIIRKFV